MKNTIKSEIEEEEGEKSTKKTERSENMSGKRFRKAVVKCATALALLFWGMVIYVVIKDDGDTPKVEQTGGVTGSEACVTSKFYVKEALKSPSTADFPFGCESESYNVTSGTWTVRSYVDAQNSFGATLRSNYMIELKYNSGGWTNPYNWSVVDISIK